jgi:uncharacterized membrane protein YfcA
MQLSLLNVELGTIIIFCAGLAQGSTAFGYGLLALPLLLYLMPMKTAVSVIAITGLFLGIQLVWSERKNIILAKIVFLIVFGVIGAFAGTYMLVFLNTGLLKIAAGILIVITSISLALGCKISIKSERFSQIIVGILSGLMQGSLSLGGPPVILFYTNQGVRKNVFRANISIFLSVLIIFTILFQTLAGITTMLSLKYSAVFILAAVAGNFLGIKLCSKMSDELFRKVVIVLIGISGLSCIFF